MHVSPQKEGFLRRLGLKTGIDFAHFGLKSGMGQCMNVFIVSIPNREVEKRNMRIRNEF